MYEVIELFIDPIVDNINPILREKLLINPIDEPLLSHVFNENQTIETPLTNNRKIKTQIPTPETLLAMKLNSVEKRTKDHKRIKDITDIFALIWYSESDLDEMKNKIKNLKPSKETEKIISNFKEHEIIQASDIINYNPEDMRRILNAFAKPDK